MEILTAKERVAELVNRWISRAGLRKEAAAARAGLTYQMLYRAFLDPGRPLSRNPDRAIALVRAFVERLTEEERCRADEALTVLDLTGTPLSRVVEVAELFPAHEWQAAFTACLEAQGAHCIAERQCDDLSPPYAQRARAHSQSAYTALRCGCGGRVAVQLRLEVSEGVLIEAGRFDAEPRSHAGRHAGDPLFLMQPAPLGATPPDDDEDVVVTIRMVV
jgi:hypothetical protein